MSNIEVKIDTEKVSKESDVTALCELSVVEITTQTGYELAANSLKLIKARYKELESQRKEITVPLDNAKKSVMDLFRTPLELLEKAESKLKSLMVGYTNEQERLAILERKRLQSLADAEAEKQRKALEKKIEKAELSGNTEKVEALQEKKEAVQAIVAPVITSKVETPKGVSYRDKWTAEVIDINLVPREYMIVNQSALDKVAQATKGSIQIAGVKFNVEKIVASR